MVYSNPFEEIEKMQEDMNRLFRHMGGRALLPYQGQKDIGVHEGFRMPVVDLNETENSIVATFELPGANKDEIELNVMDDRIEVKVEKKIEKESKDKGAYSYEKRAHSYYTSIPLQANVRAEKAEASYKNGILKVEIPKAVQVEKKKRIEIR